MVLVFSNASSTGQQDLIAEYFFVLLTMVLHMICGLYWRIELPLKQYPTLLLHALQCAGDQARAIVQRWLNLPKCCTDVLWSAKMRKLVRLPDDVLNGQLGGFA